MIGNLKKTILGITLALVFLFSSVQFASAATTETVELGSVILPAISRNYKFIVGADGIFVNDSEIDNSVDRELYQTVTYGSGTVQFTFDSGLLCARSINNIYSLSCDGGYVRYEPTIGCSVSYSDAFEQFIRSVIIVKPYMLLNGEKRYLTNSYENQVYFDYPTDNGVYIYIGADIDVIISYDEIAYNLYDVQTYISTITVNLTDFEHQVDLVGYKYISSGEQGVIDSINENTTNTATWLGTIWEDLGYHFPIIESTLTNIKDYTRNTYVWLDEKFPVLTQSILAFHTDMNNALSTANSHLNTIQGKLNITLSSLRDSIKGYIDGAKTAVVGSIQTFEENILDNMSAWKIDLDNQLTAIMDILVRGYTSTEPDKVSGDFGGAVTDMETSTDGLTNIGISGINEYTVPSNGFAGYGVKFTLAMQTVSSMIQSVYESSGNFTIAVSVLFSMTIGAMLLGLFRFFK